MTDINESPIRAESAPITFHELPDLTDVTDLLVVTCLVRILIGLGHSIEVYGGELKPDYVGTDEKAILAAIYAVEEANICATPHTSDKASCTFSALLIPSNGAECICDHNDTQFTEDVVHGALYAASKVVNP